MAKKDPCSPMQKPRRRAGKRSSDPRKQRSKRLLTWAEKNPELVLEKARCAKPEFLTDFYVEMCDDKALVEPGAESVHSRNAGRLARRIRNRHVRNRSLGAVVHSCIVHRHHRAAWEILRSYREDAMDCCPGCRNDYARRLSDLVTEATPRPLAAYLVLSVALQQEDVEDDERARFYFLRAITLHHMKAHAAALDDAGRVLDLLCFDSPRGYFLDTIAYLTVFLLHAGKDRDLYERALRHLARFRERITLVEDFAEVRTRLCWSEGVLFAGLGKFREAADRLGKAWKDLLKRGYAREAAAVTVDFAMVLRRGTHDTNDRTIRRKIEACLDTRSVLKTLPATPGTRSQPVLPGPLAAGLRGLVDVLAREPEKVLDTLAALRTSFTVPVAPLLVNLLVPERGAEILKVDPFIRKVTEHRRIVVTGARPGEELRLAVERISLSYRASFIREGVLWLTPYYGVLNRAPERILPPLPQWLFLQAPMTPVLPGRPRKFAKIEHLDWDIYER